MNDSAGVSALADGTLFVPGFQCKVYHFSVFGNSGNLSFHKNFHTNGGRGGVFHI